MLDMELIQRTPPSWRGIKGEVKTNGLAHIKHWY